MIEKEEALRPGKVINYLTTPPLRTFANVSSLILHPTATLTRSFTNRATRLQIGHHCTGAAGSTLFAESAVVSPFFAICGGAVSKEFVLEIGSGLT